MKKKALALMMSLAMILTFMPAAVFAEGEAEHVYTAPVDVKWGDTSRAEECMTLTDQTKGHYELRLYKDGTYRSTAHIGDLTSRGWSTDDWSDGKLEIKAQLMGLHMFNESGTYTFDIRVAKNDEEIKDEAKCAVSAMSDEFIYDKSKLTVLGTPSNVHWSKTDYGTIIWDPVENAGGYNVSLFEDDAKFPIRGYEVMGGNTSFDFSELIGDIDSHSYRVKVSSLSGDFSKYANGEESSDLSEPLTATAAVKSAQDAVAKASSDVTADTADAKLKELKAAYSTAEDKETLRDAVQASTETQENVKKLEDAYTNSKGITVEAPVSEEPEIKASDISVVGAGLSAEPNSTICLTVTKTVSDPDYNTDIYTNVLSFNMSLKYKDGSTKSEITDLDIPVTVTLPVPEGMNTNRLFVLHYLSDGNVETIQPEIVGDSKLAKFTITHFSIFAFAEKKDAETPSGGNTGGGVGSDGVNTPSGGGTGGGQTPSASTEPSEEDKTAAAAVTTAITALPAELTLDNEDAVKAAREAYDKLSPEQKKLVRAEELAALEKAEQTIADWKEFDANVETAKTVKVTNVKAKSLKGSKAKLTWKAHKGASSYQVQYSTSKKKLKKAAKKTVKSNKLTIKKLKRGKVYYARVRTVTEITNNATGKTKKVYGAWSAVKKFKKK